MQQDEQCNCGSGQIRFPLLDAAGIFCAYVCEQCEAEVRSKYHLSIFEPGTRYASTGEEEDIPLGWDSVEPGGSWHEEQEQ